MKTLLDQTLHGLTKPNCGMLVFNQNYQTESESESDPNSHGTVPTLNDIIKVPHFMDNVAGLIVNHHNLSQLVEVIPELSLMTGGPTADIPLVVGVEASLDAIESNKHSLLDKYYHSGAKCVMWATQYQVNDKGWTQYLSACITTQHQRLAERVKTTIDKGLVPIIKMVCDFPDTYLIQQTFTLGQKILANLMYQLHCVEVDLNYVVIHTSFVRNGNLVGDENLPLVAKLTLDMLRQTIPPSIPLVFLSDPGLNHLEASRIFTLMLQQCLTNSVPWKLSLSFSPIDSNQRIPTHYDNYNYYNSIFHHLSSMRHRFRDNLG